MLIVLIVSLHTVTARRIPARGQRPLTTCCGSGRSHLRLLKLSRLEPVGKSGVLGSASH